MTTFLLFVALGLLVLQRAVQLWGLRLLRELWDLSAQRYGEGAARAYLRTLLIQAQIQELHGLRAVAFVSDELNTLKQVMEVSK